MTFFQNFALATWLWLYTSAPVGSDSASSPLICARAGFPSVFKAASDRYLPKDHWTWLSAQCYQESNHQPRAVSPVGAIGICQIMPPTWDEQTARMGLRGVAPVDPRANILVGAAYMHRMFGIWTSPRPHTDRRRLAQASYNAGAGNIIQAQRRCDGARDWAVISACLPDITGRHARETIDYVRKIARFQADLERCGP